MTDTVTSDGINAYLDAHRDARLESLMEFLRIPSISTLPAHASDCRAAASWIARQLERIGMAGVSVEETAGHPVVYAEWLGAPDAPTIVLYCHYDVQPADPLDLWESPPFEPIVVGHRLQARGASDDKGQLHLHLMALEALLATQGRLPLNIKIVFEGEEEGASEHLEAWLTANRDRLRADAAIITDTGFFDGNRPAITIGLRGIAAAQIDVYGSTIDLHSGGYGGTVDNPILALSRILASLRDEDGRVLVPGFYDDVLPLTDRDRAALAALPFDDEEYRRSIGVPVLFGERGFTTLERRGARPTFEVNGIWGGFQGAGTKTIIPAHAHAKITCRLVPNQDPARILTLLANQVARLAPPTMRVEFVPHGGGRPSLTPIDHPLTRAAATAIESTFGVEPLYIRDGGSVPVAASFETVLDLPVALVGFAPSDEHAHAPNEFMDLRNYETGIRAVTRLWEELAGLPR